jgi:thymidylate synthase
MSGRSRTMINEPVCVVCDDFQEVWLEVARLLMASHWELRNLIVQIKNPGVLDQQFHDKISAFAQSEGLLGPKHVAYTIFPHGLYRNKGNATALFTAYNRSRGLFERLHRLKPGWGTYFRRMTHYEGTKGTVNQLDNIITAVRNRENLSRAAYTIVIQRPGGETVRPVGGPCLNYIAVQAKSGQSGQPLILGLLAVYRNHDFLERAYGNYWGLCNLLMFLAQEVGGTPGPLTCLSSHAYVSDKKMALKALLDGL